MYHSPRPSNEPPLGQLLKLYRNECRLTQRQLAEAAGVSLGTLRDVEQGRTSDPRWGALESIAAALGLNQHQRAMLVQASRTTSHFSAAAATKDPDVSGPSASGVHIKILGPLRVSLDGTTVALGSQRQRAVLAVLALFYNLGVHRDEIIDVLWSARPPSSAVTQVQGYVHRLRRLLTPRSKGGEELIITTGASYRLQVSTLYLDIATFQRLTDRADHAAVHGMTRNACRLYEQALALWQGDVIADIELLREHRAAAEWAHRYSDVIMRFGELALRADTPHRALPWLRRLSARENLNEAAAARLMEILAMTGQQAAALDVFAQLRCRLKEELGIDPSPQLAEAYLRVLRQDGVVTGRTSSG